MHSPNLSMMSEDRVKRTEYISQGLLVKSIQLEVTRDAQTLRQEWACLEDGQLEPNDSGMW